MPSGLVVGIIKDLDGNFISIDTIMSVLATVTGSARVVENPLIDSRKEGSLDGNVWVPILAGYRYLSLDRPSEAFEFFRQALKKPAGLDAKESATIGLRIAGRASPLSIVRMLRTELATSAAASADIEWLPQLMAEAVSNELVPRDVLPLALRPSNPRSIILGGISAVGRFQNIQFLTDLEYQMVASKIDDFWLATDALSALRQLSRRDHGWRIDFRLQRTPGDAQVSSDEVRNSDVAYYCRTSIFVRGLAMRYRYGSALGPELTLEEQSELIDQTKHMNPPSFQGGKSGGIAARKIADQHNSGRLNSIFALGFVPVEKVQSALADLINDPDPRIGCAAIEAVGRHATKEACSSLRKVLAGPHYNFRPAIAKALVLITLRARDKDSLTWASSALNRLSETNNLDVTVARAQASIEENFLEENQEKLLTLYRNTINTMIPHKDHKTKQDEYEKDRLDDLVFRSELRTLVSYSTFDKNNPFDLDKNPGLTEVANLLDKLSKLSSPLIESNPSHFTNDLQVSEAFRAYTTLCVATGLGSKTLVALMTLRLNNRGPWLSFADRDKLDSDTRDRISSYLIGKWPR